MRTWPREGSYKPRTPLAQGVVLVKELLTSSGGAPRVLRASSKTS